VHRGRIENSPRVQVRPPRRFCIVSPWATKYHPVQRQVNSCGHKRNRLLGECVENLRTKRGGTSPKRNHRFHRLTQIRQLGFASRGATENAGKRLEKGAVNGAVNGAGTVGFNRLQYLQIIHYLQRVYTHNLPDHKPALSSTASQSRRTYYKGLCEVYRFQYLHIIHYLHRVYHPVYRPITAPL